MGIPIYHRYKGESPGVIIGHIPYKKPLNYPYLHLFLHCLPILSSDHITQSDITKDVFFFKLTPLDVVYPGPVAFCFLNQNDKNFIVENTKHSPTRASQQVMRNGISTMDWYLHPWDAQSQLQKHKKNDQEQSPKRDFPILDIIHWI